MLVQANLKRYYNRCKEHESLQVGDDRYVDFDAKGLRGPCCRKELLKRILMEDDFCYQLFSGFRGGGKTTELYGLKQDLEQQGFVVIYGDAREYLNLTMPISTGEVLLSVAGVFDEYLEKNLGPNVNRDSFWSRMANFLQTEVKIEEFGISAPLGIEVKAALKNNPTFKAKLQDFLGKRLQIFKSQTDEFIQEAIALAKRDCEEKKGEDCQGVVLIFDNLEQLAGDTPHATMVRESLRNVFYHLANFLKIPCHAIYTVPPWVCFLSGIEATWKSCHFAMCRVTTRDNGPDANGVAAMRKFIDRRVPLAEVFGEDPNDPVLNDIILSTGGYMRDVLRVLQDFLMKIEPNDPLPLSDQRKAEVWKQIKLNFDIQYRSPVLLDDIDLLQRIKESGEIVPKNEQEIEIVASFFDSHAVLCYMDDKGRYFRPHPMVRDLILTKGP